MSKSTSVLEQLFSRFGVGDWGYTEDSKPLTYKHYLDWVDRGDSSPLSYLEDHRKDLRSDIKKFYPDFQSALVFLFPYTQARKELEGIYDLDDSNGLRVASYVLGFDGKDYHYEISQRLETMGRELEIYLHEHKFIDPQKKLEWKLSLDLHPVLDRDLAYRSGLGWFGKNSMLINRKVGSYTIIGSLLLNEKLPPELLPKKQIDTDHCGQCRACVESCPTDAINSSKRQIIASKCISTFTIETFKEANPIDGHLQNSQGEIFGCDICQDVCPWNHKPLMREAVGEHALNEKELENKVISNFLKTPLDGLINKFELMSNKAYVREFFGTPFARTGRKGMLKNLKVFIPRK